jgi:hypothetical protein
MVLLNVKGLMHGLEMVFTSGKIILSMLNGGVAKDVMIIT